MGWDVEQIRVGEFRPDELIAMFDNPPNVDPAVILWVRTEILNRADCPISLLGRAPNFDSVSLNRAAAAHSATPEAAVFACANRRLHWSVRHAALSRPDLHPMLANSIIKTWRDAGPEVRPGANGEWATVATYPPSDLACLAANPATPAGALDRLANSRLPMVLVEVARNPSTPVERIIELLGASDDIIAGAAAANPSIPPATLATWLEIEERPGWMAYRGAKNPACPEEVSEMVLTWMSVGGYTDNNTFDPASELGSPTTTGIDVAWTTSHALAHGPWNYSSLARVRALQWRSDPPAEVRQSIAATLAEDRNTSVRRVVLSHGPLLASTVDVLADDPDQEIAAMAVRYRAHPGNIASPKKRTPTRIPMWVRLMMVGCSLTAFGIRTFVRWDHTESVRETNALTALDGSSETPPAPTQAARIQFYSAKPYALSGEVGELYRTGVTAKAPASSGLGATLVWRRSGSHLQFLFSVALPSELTDDSEISASDIGLWTRTFTATWQQPGYEPQSKTTEGHAAGTVLIDVLIDPAVGGSVTITSDDEGAPFRITCDLAADCAAS